MERYPLQWPANKPRTLDHQRQDALFNKQVHNGKWNERKKLSVADAVKRVEKELDMFTRVNRPFRIPPETVIISTNIVVGVKGKPLSSLPEPQDPGVAVYFTLDGLPVCFECDKWNRVADNLAAIAAHARAMRDIERYGVGRQHDVYQGFKALPEHAGMSNGAWWQILDVPHNATPDVIKSAWRRLSAKYHPDNISTGNRNLFDQVQAAYKKSKV